MKRFATILLLLPLSACFDPHSMVMVQEPAPAGEQCPEQEPRMGLYCGETWVHFAKRRWVDSKPYHTLAEYDAAHPEHKDIVMAPGRVRYPKSRVPLPGHDPFWSDRLENF